MSEHANNLSVKHDTQDLSQEFVEYLERHLAQRGWTVHELCERSELKPSVVFRWRKGYRPDIGNARALAHAFDVPVLEVLVKAGRLTAEEASATVTHEPELSHVPTRVLLLAATQRMDAMATEVRSGNPEEAFRNYGVPDRATALADG